MYTNLDGIGNEKADVSNTIFNEKPDIISLTETKSSSEDANDHSYDTKNVVVYRKD